MPTSIPKIDMVLARSYENIDWWFKSKAYPFVDKTFVYNKGNKEDLSVPESPRHIVRTLPNTGKESSTYIKHCILNYDDLGDYTIFSQANPHDHTSTFDDKMISFATATIHKDIVYFADRCLTSDWPGKEVYNLLFAEKTDDFTFSQGSHYIVSKKAIRFRTHNFYKRCLSLFFPESGPYTNIPAYTFEGLWPTMWDGKTPQRSDDLPWDCVAEEVWGPTITTLPKASTIKPGQALSESILSDGVATVPGTFAFNTPAHVPGVGTTAHLIIFRPTDSARYKTTVQAIHVNVDPA